MTDTYYHVDMTHGSYNAMLNSCGNEHVKMEPKTILSINKNQYDTQALVKVRHDGSFNPGWNNAPFVIGTYEGGVDDVARLALVNDEAWKIPVE